MGVVEGDLAGGSRRYLAPILIGIGVLLFFYPLLLGEGQLYFRDISLNHYPTRIYSTPILRSGHLPQWNPYLAGGMPLAANPNNLIFHPITLLFLFLPVSLAFPLSIVLQVFLAGWGLFLWARECGMEETAALGGGIIYAFSGGIASCGTFHNLLSSWAWVPAALFAFTRHLRTRGRWAFIGAAAGLSVTLLAGDPLAAGTIVFLALLECFAVDWGAGARWSRSLMPLGAVLLLGLGLALIQILPARELLSASGRGAGIPYADASEWALPAARLWEWVVPSLYGNVTAIEPTSYWGGPVFEKGYQFLLTVYCGAISVLLAVASLGARPRLRPLVLWLATLACVLVALGDRALVYAFLYRHLPLLANLRYPSRFLLPTFVFLSFLSAMGLDRLRRESDTARAGATTRLMLAGAIPLASLTGVISLFPSLRLSLLVGPMGVPAALGDAVLTSASGKLAFGFSRCAVLALVGAALVVAAKRRWITPALSGGLLVSTIGLDLIAANLHVNPVVPASFLSEKPPIVELLHAQAASPRVFSEKRPKNLAVWAESDSVRWGYLWNHLTLRVCTGLPYQVPQAYQLSMDLLSPPLVNALAEAMPRLPPDKFRRLCDLASVGFLMSYRDLSDAGMILEGSVADRTNIPLRIYRDPGALPRAYLVAGARPEQGEPLQALTDPAFDPRLEVYLDGPAQPDHQPGSAGIATILEDFPERVVIAIAAERPAWMVLTDNDYPGWTARLDGEQVPIRRANFLFRAVRVPAGEHQVAFEYRPSSLFFGGIGSLLSLLALGAWLFLSAPTPRAREGETPGRSAPNR